MKIRKLFTNTDVFAITKELNLILLNSTIVNVYEIEDILILKINTKEEGRKNFIIKSDTRINLTEYDYPIPKYPSQYILSLRKFLKNKRILSISQYNFDRIIVLQLSNPEGQPWKFIIELFNKGNFLLLDDKSVLKIAKKYRKFKDRDVLAGKHFIFPKSRGKDFLSINKNEFKELFNTSDIEIVKNLARNINIAGLYSEEICYRAGIDKNKIGKNLNEADLNNLFISFKKLRNELLFGNIKAHIVLDNTGAEISVLPFEIEIFKDYEKKYFNSFNKAVDEFYSKIDSEIIKKPSDEKINEKIKAQEKILKNQIDYLEELKLKKRKYYERGDFIYAHFKSIENMLNVVLNAKSKGYSLEEINKKLQSAKIENSLDFKYFVKIIPSSKQLVIKVNDDHVYLDLKKSIGENANLIYFKGKKANKKIKGTIQAIEKTKKIIERLNSEIDLKKNEVDFLIKKPKKRWYEKFRWFISSDEFLVIGGRDATSNEAIFKKYLDPNDLVFHTTFPGSPLAIIKNPDGKKIPQETIQETANFVASYSRAWKETWGVVDVFYITPEQISKTPPSGEYLSKGSFIISGKKNFVKNAKTELAIGLEMIEIETNSNEETKIYYPKILCGPKNAIKGQINGNIIIIEPSKTGLNKGTLAKKIKQYYLKKSEDNLKKWINLLSIDEIILSLPSGTSVLKIKS
ncbi:MAG: ribosome rescue protein RqcH [Promethearchaeota archaeon]